MGPEKRNAIRKALNEDAEKLLEEGDPSDPQLDDYDEKWTKSIGCLTNSKGEPEKRVMNDFVGLSHIYPSYLLIYFINLLVFVFSTQSIVVHYSSSLSASTSLQLSHLQDVPIC